MTATLMLIWDYDAAIGQVNASYPYKFDEAKLFHEISNVETILELGKSHNIKMTFACLGFAAEPGMFPYHIPEQIKRIHQEGHEIASHSWKHEWFPFLERDQIIKSLERSKYALETCLQSPGRVVGFVPPFNRPMSWYARGAVSFGDRVWGPRFPGADLGSLLQISSNVGYQWCRVVYRSPWRRLTSGQQPSLKKDFERSNGMVCVPHHYTGFDKQGQELLMKAIESGTAVVIVGHPSGLTRDKEENIDHLKKFIEMAALYQMNGKLLTSTVHDFIKMGSA